MDRADCEQFEGCYGNLWGSFIDSPDHFKLEGLNARVDHELIIGKMRIECKISGIVYAI
jgi:hypothetical protein